MPSDVIINVSISVQKPKDLRSRMLMSYFYLFPHNDTVTQLFLISRARAAGTGSLYLHPRQHAKRVSNMDAGG